MQVQGYQGDEELDECLKDCDVVAIPAGVPRKPGLSPPCLYISFYCLHAPLSTSPSLLPLFPIPPSLLPYLTPSLPHSFPTSLLLYLTPSLPHSFSPSLLPYLTPSLPHSFLAGMTRDDLFNTNASIVRNLVQACARYEIPWKTPAC